MRLGAHCSTAGGLANAIAEGRRLDCEAIQVMVRIPQRWTSPPLDDADVAAFRAGAEETGFARDAVSHTSYLINLCAPDESIHARSKAALIDEIERCATLGIPYACLHPGSPKDGGDEEWGLAAIATSLREVLRATRGKPVVVLLENTAGQGTNLGWRFEHLGRIITKTNSRRVGVCIDTCHLFAAGYDFRDEATYRETIAAMDAAFGLDRIRAFHLNDSKSPLGSRVDRHENIGHGEIGREAFARLINDPRFADLPGLLETPGGTEKYAEDLATLRTMLR